MVKSNINNYTITSKKQAEIAYYKNKSVLLIPHSSKNDIVPYLINNRSEISFIKQQVNCNRHNKLNIDNLIIFYVES